MSVKTAPIGLAAISYLLNIIFAETTSKNEKYKTEPAQVQPKLAVGKVKGGC